MPPNTHTRTRTPPVLHPYLSSPPPPQSLILLTGTLSCSANWLTTRFIGHALDRSSETGGGRDGGGGEVGGVVLVSWQRDLKFWKDEVRRATGIDLSRFSSSTSASASASASSGPTNPTSPEQDNMPTLTFIDLLSSSLLPPSKTALADLEKTIIASTTATSKPILLILDTPTTHLTLNPEDSLALSTTILNLRSHDKVHSTVLSASADTPYLSAALPTISPASVTTPLEAATASFTLSQAHQARCILSVRELETGAARDVSGVLRATRGGGWDEVDADGLEEGEWRYLVGRDGTVKIVE